MVSTFRNALFLLLIAPAIAAAQQSPEAAAVRIDVPLFDVPYNADHGYRAPSMQQAQAVTEGFYELSHRTIQHAWGEHKWFARFSIVGADLLDSLVLPLPATDGWLHEEYHRTVLGRRGFGSFNDVYKFKVAADSIAVSHVADADLVQLKREHPAEQVRLSAAGLEGEQLLVLGLQRREFFDRSRSFQMPIYWLEKLGGLAYVTSGVSDDTNAETDDMNAREGANVKARDFTGHDFTAWVYDLHRPFEAYEARGVHPSGVGIDRYIKPSDLSAEELAYLRKQGHLQALNFLDPFLFAFRGMAFDVHGAPLRVNANMSHLLTSFGRTIDTNVFIARGRMKLLTTVHAYANGERSFAGVDATLVDYPVVLGGRTFAVSPRLALWQQPEEQLFRATSGNTGGLVALKVQHTAGQRLGAFAEVEAKSAGWVAGVESLDRNVSVRVGLSLIVR